MIRAVIILAFVLSGALIWVTGINPSIVIYALAVAGALCGIVGVAQAIYRLGDAELERRMAAMSTLPGANAQTPAQQRRTENAVLS